MYPPADERRYHTCVSHKGYTIASFVQFDEPIFQIGAMPVFQVYFILDECGDNVLEVDRAFLDYYTAVYAVDLFVHLRSAKSSISDDMFWLYVSDAYRMRENLPEMMAIYRQLVREMKEFNSDGLGLDGTADELKQRVIDRLEKFMCTIPAWKSTPELISQNNC